jgi:hypothetical protein
MKDKIAVQQAVSAGLEAEGVDIGRIWHVLHTEIFQHWPEPQPACEVCGRDCCGYLRGWADCKASSERSEPAAASVPQGGEFTAAEVKKAAEHVAAQFLAFGLRTQADKYDRMLRAYARALSSAPGERT